MTMGLSLDAQAQQQGFIRSRVQNIGQNIGTLVRPPYTPVGAQLVAPLVGFGLPQAGERIANRSMERRNGDNQATPGATGGSPAPSESASEQATTASTPSTASTTSTTPAMTPTAAPAPYATGRSTSQTLAKAFTEATQSFSENISDLSRRQMRSLSRVIDAAQPDPSQLKAFGQVIEAEQPKQPKQPRRSGLATNFANGFEAIGNAHESAVQSRTDVRIVKNLGSVQLPKYTYTVDNGSYSPQTSQRGTFIKSALSGTGNLIGGFLSGAGNGAGGFLSGVGNGAGGLATGVGNFAAGVTPLAGAVAPVVASYLFGAPQPQ